MVGGVAQAPVEVSTCCGWYVGSTPPLPLYVTKAMLESEVGRTFVMPGATPLIVAGTIPGSVPVNTVPVLKTAVAPSATGQAPAGRPVAVTTPGDVVVPIARSVKV